MTLWTSKRISGPRSFHFFSPVSMTTISTNKISADDAIVFTFHFSLAAYDITDQLRIKYFVCCNCDIKWYIGQVEEIGQKEGDARIKFMHPNASSRSFYWPTRVAEYASIDECFPHFLSIIDNLSTQSGIQYQLTQQCKTWTDCKTLAKLEQWRPSNFLSFSDWKCYDGLASAHRPNIRSVQGPRAFPKHTQQWY